MEIEIKSGDINVIVAKLKAKFPRSRFQILGSKIKVLAGENQQILELIKQLDVAEKKQTLPVPGNTSGNKIVSGIEELVNQALTQGLKDIQTEIQEVRDKSSEFVVFVEELKSNTQEVADNFYKDNSAKILDIEGNLSKILTSVAKMEAEIKQGINAKIGELEGKENLIRLAIVKYLQDQGKAGNELIKACQGG